LVWFFVRLARNPRKKRRKRKKEKQFHVKPRRTIIHAPSKEEEDIEINQIVRQNQGYNHRSQPHMSPKDDRATNVCEACVINYLFCTKLKSKLNKSNGKGNVVIILFYQIWKHPCAKGIKLFYLKVTLIILLCLKKHNYQNNLTPSSKGLCYGKKTT